MRKKSFLVLIILTFVFEGVIAGYFLYRSRDIEQDTVAVNDCVKVIEENFGQNEKYLTNLSYSLIDTDGNLLYTNADDISTSVNEAVKNNDTILDVKQGDKVVGKVLFHNQTQDRIEKTQRAIAVTFLFISAIQ